MSKDKSFLAFSCPHFGVEDEQGLHWLLDKIEELKPDVLVCLGDLFDAKCLGEFVDAGGAEDLEREYRRAEPFINEINKILPKSTKVHQMGNHIERMERARWAKVASLIDYRKHIPGFKGWVTNRYVQDRRHMYTLGQVVFSHGFTAGVHTVKKEAASYCLPYGLYVMGHTHRPHPVHKVRLGASSVPYWYVNPGTFIDIDRVKEVGYMKTNNSTEWGSGIVYGKAQLVPKDPFSRCWTADLVLYKSEGASPVYEDGIT